MLLNKTVNQIFILALLVAPTVVSASDIYPSKPLRVIVTFAAGGGTDLIARLLSPKMSAQLGQPVVVENRPGAAGQLGAEFAVSAPADGYTVLLASSSTATLPYLRKTKYDLLEDFVPVGQVGVGGFVLVTNPKLPFKTLGEFMSAAKANPGKYTYGSIGQGSLGHIGLALLKAKSGVDMVHVPYKSSTEVAYAIISGQIDSAIDTLPVHKPFIDAQSANALATTGPIRDVSLPQVPTFNESKLIPGGFELTFWYGFFVPRATPTPVVERVQAAFAAVMKDPEVIQRLKDFGVAPSQITAAEFHSNIASEVGGWRKVIKDNKIMMND
ncbi:tripartite tricarboxylate transporter substrate binding protein [Alcaligenaceae bacterium]|nr:tripartite tricarboxylate transporter substrate binding protein [Alcaligenaceae bacterium]